MINSVVLVGRLTRDPELKYTRSNNAMCSFTLAVDKRSSSGDRDANFISCKVFNKSAENLCRYQSKGSLIGVEGCIDTGSYQNKDGQTVYTTDVLVSRVVFFTVE